MYNIVSVCMLSLKFVDNLNILDKSANDLFAFLKKFSYDGKICTLLSNLRQISLFNSWMKVCFVAFYQCSDRFLMLHSFVCLLFDHHRPQKDSLLDHRLFL